VGARALAHILNESTVNPDPMTSTDRYLLGAAAPEIERLRIQAEALRPFAESLFETIGVREGWNCVDLACGPVGVLRSLSHLTGSTGSVVGVDRESNQVAAASQFVKENELANVKIVRGDAMDTGLPRKSFDLVHSRFLLAPAGRADLFLKEMRALVRPGGLLVLEEPSSQPWRCFPPSDSFDRLKSAIVRAFSIGGGDFDAGEKALDLLRARGLEQVQARAFAPVLTDRNPYMRAPIQFASSLRSTILEHRLLSESDLDAAIMDLDRVISRPGTWMTSFLVIQAWGRAPPVS
jgi:SAM-dependent methyltransferase